VKIISLAIFLLCATVFAQDFITKTNGEDIKAKVIEVGTTEIRYKKYEFPDGPLYVILKSEVLMIRYENGSKDIFNNQSPVPNTPAAQPLIQASNLENLSDNEMALRGEQDALQNYTKYTSAATGSFVGGLLCGICGFPIPLAIADATPKDEDLDCKDPSLLKNTS